MVKTIHEKIGVSDGRRDIDTKECSIIIESASAKWN
jgi:hypothetical protein